MKIKVFLPLFVLAGFLLFLPLKAAKAQEPQLLATHGNWSVYTFSENGNKVCYMASKPVKAEGAYSRRGEIFALVTNRPSENTRDVFSYMTGYEYKLGSSSVITIDGQSFDLFTQGETAWAPDANTDAQIATALRQGSKMVVTGVSTRGTKTKDTFSLNGSGAAHDSITQECQ